MPVSPNNIPAETPDFGLKITKGYDFFNRSVALNFVMVHNDNKIAYTLLHA